MMKKYKTNKLSFWVAENIIYFLMSLVCIAVLFYTYSIRCSVTQNIVMAIATSALASVFIPLGLNIGKFVHEKRSLNSLCKSIIGNSVFLIRGLNTYIAAGGKAPYSCYSEFKNRKSLATLDLENFDTFDELFLLILGKMNRIAEMEYLNKTDLFEFAVQKMNASVPLAVSEKNYNQLFGDLILVLGAVVKIKAPFGRPKYIQRFDNELKKSYIETEFLYFQSTDDYIVRCIEKELSEKRNEA